MRKTELMVAAVLAVFAGLADTNSTDRVERETVESGVFVSIDAEGALPVPYAVDVTMSADSESAASAIPVHTAWYANLEPVPGSRLYWVVFAAKELDRQGRDTQPLETAAADTLAKWLKGDEK